jgi:hypothetical protein
MKKIVLFFAILVITGTANSIAQEIAMQYVVTDCGTVHQIRSDASGTVALVAQYYWTLVDCG